VATTIQKLRRKAHAHQDGRCFYCDLPVWESVRSPLGAYQKGRSLSAVHSRTPTGAPRRRAQRIGKRGSRMHLVQSTTTCRRLPSTQSAFASSCGAQPN
jgi:hypothetical protein